MTNRKLIKAKKLICVISAFSIENVLNMKFSTIPLQSCPSCKNFCTFVVNYT